MSFRAQEEKCKGKRTWKRKTGSNELQRREEVEGEEEVEADGRK